MARPIKCRNIVSHPRSYYFKPRGIPLCELEEISLAADEFQALKYYDSDGKSQIEAAEAMGISRQTFGNIIASARRKIAEALVHGKALKIEKFTENDKEKL